MAELFALATSSEGNHLVTCNPFIARSLTFSPANRFLRNFQNSVILKRRTSPTTHTIKWRKTTPSYFPDTFLIRQIPFQVLLDRQPCTYIPRLCLACCLSFTASLEITNSSSTLIQSYLRVCRLEQHFTTSLAFSWPQPRYLLQPTFSRYTS